MGLVCAEPPMIPQLPKAKESKRGRSGRSPFLGDPPSDRAGAGVAARDSGKPLGHCASRCSSLAPWSCGPSLQRRYPPCSLLWPLLTSPPLSRRSSPQLRRCFFPFTPSGSTSHVSDGSRASLRPASLPPVRGLSAGSCSYGQRLVPRFLQLGSRRSPRRPPCGSLRLPPSVPVSTLQLTRKQPMLGTLAQVPRPAVSVPCDTSTRTRFAPGSRSGRPTTLGRARSPHGEGVDPFGLLALENGRSLFGPTEALFSPPMFLG